jgi:hypothetical protein
MDTSYVDETKDDGRNSEGSTQDFSFASTRDLRKNLRDVFDKISMEPPPEKPVAPALKVAAPVPLKKPSSVGSTFSVSSSCISDRIAQFEQVAQQNNAKPPLPLKLQPNAIPQNSVSVYLRIRPPMATSGLAKISTSQRVLQVNTIDVLPAKRPNVHPTIVRTYPPAQSNASKVNIHRENDPASCAKEYSFHQVLEPETTQQTVYATIAAPLVQSLFAATSASDKASSKQRIEQQHQIESALLFSYGITNAGKTYTILGNIKGNNDAQWGVIPRAISECFDHIRKLPKIPCHYDLYLSYFEIYNEQIYDLLPKKKAPTNVGPPQALKVSERPGQTIVRGLAKHRVRDLGHGIELTVTANNKRRTQSNNLNVDSSRSHCICQLQIVPRSIMPDTVNKQATNDDDSVISMSGYSTDEEAAFFTKHKSSTLWIVDLAGSERSKRTGLGNERQKEASSINKSLMTLMRCLSVMRESQQSRQRSADVVPFRESKLTHLFMNHLTGPSASRTSMIVNVNPSVADFDETQHVLSYASQAKIIQMDPKELSKKRRQYFGAEYDMNGRKKAKTAKITSTAIAPTSAPITSTSATAMAKAAVIKITKALSPKRLAKKMSPKKLAKNLSFKKQAPKMASFGKRKAEESSEPLLKRVCHPTVASSDKGSDSEKDTKSLKMRLTAALAEAEMLRSENTKLLEQLSQQESQVREEVAEEMAEQLKTSSEEYNGVIERLRAQIHANPTTCKSTRKAQMDRAEQQIEELLDKIDECEEEMVRMRHDHAKEIAELKELLNAKPVAVPVSDAPIESASQTNTRSNNKQIAELERELAASREQVERLKKTKLELIENYEKLLHGDDDGEEEMEADSSRDSNKNAQKPPPWKREATQAENRPAGANVASKLIGRTLNDPRRPLVSILSNISNTVNNAQLSPSGSTFSDDSTWARSGKGEQWLFPKNPTTVDVKTRSYRRPSGRAPVGRVWDASVGAWKLMAT